MKRIYKYPLNTFGLPTKIKEKISRILSIQLQRDQVYVWIEIDDWDRVRISKRTNYFDSIQENHFYWRYIKWCNWSY